MMTNKDITDTFDDMVIHLSQKEIKVLLTLLNDCSSDDCDAIFTKLKNKFEEKTIDVFDDINGIWNMF